MNKKITYKTEMKRQLIIKNKVSEIPHLARLINEIGTELKLSSSFILNLNLALEEAVVNIISYAYPKEKNDQNINIEVQKENNLLIFTLKDKGKAFNPTKVKKADTSLSVEERPIGGLGIFLIKKIMDEVDYQHIDNHNVFILKKRLPSP